MGALIAVVLLALGGIVVTRVLTMARQAPAAPSSPPPLAPTADLGAADVEAGRAPPIEGTTETVASDTTATPVTASATATTTTARTMADAGLQMPDGWPALLALSPNAVLIAASGAAEGGVVQAVTTDDPAAVMGFYRGRFSGRKVVDNKANMLMVNTGEGLGIVMVDASGAKPHRSMVTLSFQKLRKR